MKRVLLFISCFLCLASASGQEELWDTYLARFGDKPGSVLVNLALMQRAPDRRYPYLVVTGPRATGCDRNGMPGKEELPSLEGVLQSASDFIQGVTANVLVGTFTYSCQRLNYYYVKDSTGIRDALMRTYRNFPESKCIINIKHDPEWTAYRTTLYPGDTVLNWMENNRIITGMLANGDKLQAERLIKFDLYFSSDSTRSAFVDAIATKGYKTEARRKVADTRTPFQLIVSKTGKVSNHLIDSLTMELKAEAARFSGVYRTWDAVKQ